MPRLYPYADTDSASWRAFTVPYNAACIDFYKPLVEEGRVQTDTEWSHALVSQHLAHTLAASCPLLQFELELTSASASDKYWYLGGKLVYTCSK